MSALVRHGANGVVGVVFSLIGAASFAVAAYLAWDLHGVRQTWVHAPGTVVGFHRRCNKGCADYPVVNFEVDGRRLAVTGKVGNSGVDEGEGVDVLYPPGHPDQARIDHWGQSGFGILFGAFFTLVFGGIGLPMLYATVARGRGSAWARQSGVTVQARFTEIARDTRVRVNGRSPYRIVAQWQNPRDARVYRFQSDAIWIDPTEYLRGREQLTVKVDPDRPQRYWMDTSFLPRAG
ncbi:MAG TPA: DUF3592 domain-containing protein [Candidatus Binatia bacterium]|nr:DUF3592 domain-containing protein [Candidatus Binatia bacterium]